MNKLGKFATPLVAATALLVTITPTQAQATVTIESKKKVKDKTKKCKKSKKFREHQVHFGTRAIRAGRCVTDHDKRIKAVWSRPGHHPSAGRALDIMVNTHGSCKAGRATGFNVAKFLMKNSGKLGVMYIIWNNRYWSASTSKRPVKKWRYMGRGPGCTVSHHDHVHVSFR